MRNISRTGTAAFSVQHGSFVMHLQKRAALASPAAELDLSRITPPIRRAGLMEVVQERPVESNVSSFDPTAVPSLQGLPFRRTAATATISGSDLEDELCQLAEERLFSGSRTAVMTTAATDTRHDIAQTRSAMSEVREARHVLSTTRSLCGWHLAGPRAIIDYSATRCCARPSGYASGGDQQSAN